MPATQTKPTAAPKVPLHTDEELMHDRDLVMKDTDAARAELQRRIEWRGRMDMRLRGLIEPEYLIATSEETLMMLADLGVDIAADELGHRLVAGRTVT